MVGLLEEVSGAQLPVADSRLRRTARINEVVGDVERIGSGFYFKRGSDSYDLLLDKWTDAVLARNAKNPLPLEQARSLRAAYNTAFFDTRAERETALKVLYEKGVATGAETREILGKKLELYMANKFAAIYAYLKFPK